MDPAALPVRVRSSHVTLPPEAVDTLFGTGYRLRGTERVDVYTLGQRAALVEARAGESLRLVLDALDREAVETTPLRLVGPKGVLEAPPPEPVHTHLVLPDALRSAWGFADGRLATVGLGSLALSVPVVPGEAPVVLVDRTVALASGTPDGPAHLLPAATAPFGAPAQPARAHGVITENDVRQARRRRQKIRPAPGQVVTPAARILGRELGVFEEERTPED